MVSVKNLFLFASAASALTTPSQVQDDVIAIDTNVKSLILSVDAYNGGYLPALPLLADLTAVYGALGKGVIDSGLLPSSVSEVDAYALIHLVNTTLAVDNPKVVNALKMKKGYFQEEGLDGIIVAALGLLKAGHDAFSFDVLQRVPADAVEDAKVVIEIIDAALQDGIDTFEAKN